MPLTAFRSIYPHLVRYGVDQMTAGELIAAKRRGWRLEIER